MNARGRTLPAKANAATPEPVPPLFAMLAAQPAAATAAPDATPEPLPRDPRLDALVEKYLAKALRGGDDAKYYTRELLDQLLERTKRAVETRDYEILRSLRFRKLNPFEPRGLHHPDRRRSAAPPE